MVESLSRDSGIVPRPPGVERYAQVPSEIQIHADENAVADAAAEFLVDEAASAIRARGRFTIALSGGSTPRLLFERLATAYSTRFEWARMHFFWVDERCVPEGDPEGNYQMAHDLLLAHVPIPESHVHRIRGEHPDPHGAAIEYERMLKKFFSFPSVVPTPFDASGRAADATPEGLRPESTVMAFSRATFDVILLGLGEDGHTASLFPGNPILEEKRHWVYAVHAPDGVMPAERVTLTLPALAAASRAVFLVTGDRKREVFSAIRADAGAAAERYPAARVTAGKGVLWIADEAAAGLKRG